MIANRLPGGLTGKVEVGKQTQSTLTDNVTVWAPSGYKSL